MTKKRYFYGEGSGLRRFCTHVSFSPNSCWEWAGALDGKGYGVFKVRGRLVRSHRFMYTAVVGPPPVGLDLDHLCRNRRCVNPLHLEPVTRKINLARGIGRYKQRKAEVIV